MLAITVPLGLAGWWMAWERNRAATNAEKTRFEILWSSHPFLADHAPLESNPRLANDILRGLREAVAQQPTNASLWRSKAVVLHRTGGRQEALTDFSQAIELATFDANAEILNDTLRRRSKLLRELGRGGEAGLDARRASGLPYEHLSPDALPDYERASEVSVEFGDDLREQGLYVVEGGDSRHAPAVHNGDEAWFFRPGWNYAYFFIDPTFKWNLGSNAVVRVEYHVVGGKPIGLQFDDGRSTFTPAPKATLEKSGQWEVVEFTLRNARFRNSQNGRADFRLFDNENGFLLRRISVSRYERKPPRILPRPPSTGSNQVDLTTFYNASLRHYMPGGIFEAATNVLAQIRQNTGVEFDARGYLGLHRRGEELDGGKSPESVTGIPIGRRLTRLHFLQSASYGEREGTHIGSYIVRLADGTQEEFPIVYGENVRSERGDYRPIPEAEVAWEGEGIRTGAGTRVRIYKVSWANPRPEVEVKSLDFTSARTRSSPHLLAITVE